MGIGLLRFYNFIYIYLFYIHLFWQFMFFLQTDLFHFIGVVKLFGIKESYFEKYFSWFCWFDWYNNNQRGREEERKTLAGGGERLREGGHVSPASSLLKCLQQPEWGRTKPGLKKSICVYHVGSRGILIELSSAAS